MWLAKAGGWELKVSVACSDKAIPETHTEEGKNRLLQLVLDCHIQRAHSLFCVNIYVCM